MGIINYGIQNNSLANIEEIQFTPVENAELNTVYYSNTGKLISTETGLEINISNGRFSINEGERNNQTGMIYS